MDIIDRLNKIVSEYRSDSAQLTEDATFDELGFDSLDKVELLMKIEEEFCISFDDDLKVETIKDLITKIQSAI